jgi:hypothetical protein
LSSSGFNGCILLLVCVSPPPKDDGNHFYRNRSIPWRFEVATQPLYSALCLPVLKVIFILMMVFVYGGLRWFTKGPPPTQKYRGAAWFWRSVWSPGYPGGATSGIDHGWGFLFLLYGANIWSLKNNEETKREKKVSEELVLPFCAR